MVSSIVAASANSEAQFKNTSDKLLHIRRLKRAVHCDALAITEHATVEVGKSPVLAFATEGNTFPSVATTVNNPGVAAADNDASETDLFARGQFTLEPNESIFMNLNVGGTPNTQGFADVWYEY